MRDFELEICFEEGAIINLLANASPLRDGDGKVRGAVAVGVDITARKEAERSLRRERQLLQTIIDRIPVMITLYEPDAKLLNINREFTRVTGWAPEDIRGVSLMEEFYPDPAYRAEVEAFMNACKDGWMDIKMRRRDGALIDTTWANIALADGRRVGIGADIGERKRSERQRLSLINELNHRVKNTLATVQSIAMQTMRGAADSQEAFLRFETRLVALARAHDVLTKENWERADLRSVVERVLEPFRAERDRFTVRGDSVRLAPRQLLLWRWPSTNLPPTRSNTARFQPMGEKSRSSGRLLQHDRRSPSFGEKRTVPRFAARFGKGLAPASWKKIWLTIWEPPLRSSFAPAEWS